MPNFPTSLDTLTNPTATDYLNSPSHAGQHATANDILEALEAKVGVDSSAVTTSHDYKIGRASDVGKYAADAGGDDTYAITLSPAPAAYYAGMEINFKPTTANTGACTLDVNSLGAVAIKKNVSSDLATGDILAGQTIKVIHDGTNFQLVSSVPGTIPVKASGAEVTTGTDNAKFATPKALADAGVNTRLKSKITSATRDYAGASGDVAYTGVGFTPTAIHVLYGKASATVGDGVGFADSAGAEYSINFRQNNGTQRIGGDFIYSDIIAGGVQSAVLKTFDADGFTLTWTKLGTPTGTMSIAFLSLR